MMTRSDGVLADTLLRRATGRSVLPGRGAAEVGLALAGVLLLALAAHVQIPLPFTPVPITGQTFAVLLIGAAYGPWRGATTLAAYLAAGLAGLPVFADVPGVSGYGYLVGFLLAAVVVGWLARGGWDRSPLRALAAMLAGEVVIYACALPWLALFFGWGDAVAFGLAPFLIGDIIKLAAAATVLPAAWWLVRRTVRTPGNTPERQA